MAIENDRVNTTSRRKFLRRSAAAAGLGGAAIAAGCGKKEVAAGDKPRLKAAFSNAGLVSTWCKLGQQTALLWGDLLGVEVTWFDGEMNPQKQRDKIDAIVHKDWDFCCFQAYDIDSLAAPVRKLRDRGIPVISMDTLVVPREKMRETGVWVQVAPDQVFMGESSSRYLMETIGGKGKVIHIGGASSHSGAQGRKAGFDNVVKNYPNVEVVGGGVRWCDWEKQKARDTFESLLAQAHEPVAGAFFHSDDMALACLPALRGTIHADMVVTAVDGQKEGLRAVDDGTLAATTVNPVCLIHKTALEIGQFIVRNQEKIDAVPPEVITPGPLVSKKTGNLQAMLYLADPAHCLV